MKIIKDAEKLRSNYIPDKLLFREDLIRDINLKIKIGTGNMFLQGDTGTGKTASVMKAIEKIDNVLIVFINCSRYDTYTSVGMKIIESIKTTSIRPTGRIRAGISEELAKVLTTKRKKKIVFIFDEVDKLINKERDHQQIFNPIVESTNSNIILISNEPTALNKLDARLISRLSPEKRFVPKYFFDEMFEILKHRAKIGLVSKNYDVEAIAKISRWIFKTTGDIREALNLLYEISCLAEKNKCRLTVELFEEAKNRVEDMEFDEAFAYLPTQQQLIMASIAKIAIKEIENYADSTEVYNFYSQCARDNSEPVLLQRQFERLLQKLIFRKLIETGTKSPKGRRGKMFVYYPKFDTRRFMEKYWPKYS